MKKRILFLMLLVAMLISGCSTTRESGDLLALGNEDKASVESVNTDDMPNLTEEKEDTEKKQSDTVKKETKNKETNNTEKKTTDSKATAKPEQKTTKTEKKTEATKKETEKKQETKTEKKTEQKKETSKPTEEAKKSESKKTDNKLDSMSAAEKKEVNKFLSNFSEAGYRGTAGGVAANAEKISFAFHHMEVNESNSVIYNDLQMGISADDTDRVLERFFGESVPHETPDGSEWIYEDGYFMMRAASGESRAYFSVATSMKDNKDGTFNVDFNVYHDSKNPQDYPNDAWYSLSDSDANSKYKKVGSGSAVLEAKTYNGSNTYQIVFYKAN